MEAQTEGDPSLPVCPSIVRWWLMDLFVKGCDLVHIAEISGSTDLWNQLKAQSPPFPPPPPLEQHLLDPVRTAVSDPAAPLGLKQPVGWPQDSPCSEFFFYSVKSAPADCWD